MFDRLEAKPCNSCTTKSRMCQGCLLILRTVRLDGTAAPSAPTRTCLNVPQFLYGLTRKVKGPGSWRRSTQPRACSKDSGGVPESHMSYPRLALRREETPDFRTGALHCEEDQSPWTVWQWQCLCLVPESRPVLSCRGRCCAVMRPTSKATSQLPMHVFLLQGGRKRPVAEVLDLFVDPPAV